jgi:hypothetical protein
METLFDFEAKHARRTDAETSHAAAAQAVPVAQNHIAIIANYLKRIYPADATADEIAIATKLDRHKVLKRLPDLQVAKLASPTDRTRMMRSKRRGRCWIWNEGKQ